MTLRLLLVAVLCCTAVLGSPSIRAQETSTPSPETPQAPQTPETPQAQQSLVDQVVQALSPREKIGQLFMVGFQGPEVSPQVQQFISQNKVGAVFLTREACNIVNGANHDPKFCGFAAEADPDTPGQVARLAQQIQSASCDATKRTVSATFCLPMFVSVDHEGDGRPLTRLVNRFTAIPSNMAIGATFAPEQAKTVGCIVGKELGAVGVNMLLGPDLDLLESPRSGGAGDQGIRTFGGDPLWVAEMAGAYVRGVQECGKGSVAAIAKHFPGHGRSTRGVDYEDIPVVVGKTLEELSKTDLASFAAVAQGKPGDPGVVDGIMNSHLSYPAVPGCDERTPVTFSPTCMQAFVSLSPFARWRQAQGLTVADDLAAGAAQAYAKEKFGTYAQAQIAEEALLAGNDLLPLIRPWQWEALPATIDELAGRYESSQAFRERVDDAVRRIVELKERMYPQLDPAVVTKATEYQGIVGQPESASQVASIAARGLTFITPSTRDDFLHSLPAPTATDRILFIECWDDPTCTAPNTNDTPNYPPVWPRGKLAALTEELFPGRIPRDHLKTINFTQLRAVLQGTSDDARKDVEEANWLVFAYLERDPTDFPDSEVLKDFLGRGPSLFDLRSKKVVLFAYNSPYHFDAGELGNVNLFVALYTKTEASLRASVRALFQDSALFEGSGGQGRLPVEYISGDYVLSDLSKQVAADPAQTVQIAITPEKPSAGEEVTVSIDQPLMARNGYRVPNGTAVTFTFGQPDGQSQQVQATTADGRASASFTPNKPGKVPLTITSGDLQWSPPKPLAIGGGGGFPLMLVITLVGGLPLALAAGGVAVYGGRRWLRSRAARAAGAPSLPPSRQPSLAPSGQPTTALGESSAPSGTQATIRVPSGSVRTFAGERYTVVRQLGEGAQKTVYLVRDTAIDRDCALALLKTEAMDADGIFRIKREAQAMGSLTHPNIVVVYDVGEEAGRPYIVCEYIPGGDLQQELRRAAGPLPLDRALAIGQDVCRALAAAHQRGITHRDVKPGNIWLMEDGGAKLGDFGLALAIDRSRLTMAGTAMGTAAYMAPEQAQGQPIDARSDLYSLGCLLYELATGRPPFIADDPIAVVSQHIHATPLPPSHYHADVPERLERLILSLLAKAQGERPASAGDVLHELGEIAARQ